MVRLAPLDIAPCPIPLLPGDTIAHSSRAVAAGGLLRIRPGVLVDAAAWEELAPWDRYLARVHAAALIHPDAVFAMESAAALLGLPVFGDPRVVHVLALAGGTSRMSAGIRIHTGRNDRTVIERDGILLTEAGDTVVDLARLRHPAVGLSVADAVARANARITSATLLECNASRASSRGRAHARWALERASAEPESVLESVSRAVFEWLGMPEPHLQVSFGAEGEKTDRPDFTWRLADGRLVCADADGDLKYDGRYGEPVEILRRQSARDARLRERVDAIAHFGWSDVLSVAPLRGILRSLGLKPEAPEHSALLLTLRRALSSPRENAPAGRNSGR